VSVNRRHVPQHVNSLVRNVDFALDSGDPHAQIPVQTKVSVFARATVSVRKESLATGIVLACTVILAKHARWSAQAVLSYPAKDMAHVLR